MCGESWHLVGNSCLKFITAKDSYDNAKLACRSHNAVLASLTTPKKVDFVLKELQMMSAVVRTNTARLSLARSRQHEQGRKVKINKVKTNFSLIYDPKLKPLCDGCPLLNPFIDSFFFFFFLARTRFVISRPESVKQISR